MAIYTPEEFTSYVQEDEVRTDILVLLRELVTGLIEEIDGKDYSDSGTEVTSSVKAVALEAAARAYRNPEGVQSKTRNIDDFSQTDRWDAGSLGVFLTAEDEFRLRPRHARARSVVLQTHSTPT